MTRVSSGDSLRRSWEWFWRGCWRRARGSGFRLRAFWTVSMVSRSGPLWKLVLVAVKYFHREVDVVVEKW